MKCFGVHFTVAQIVVDLVSVAVVALAYASHTNEGTVPIGVERWVEKTPTNEQFLTEVWREFDEQVVKRGKLPQRTARSIDNPVKFFEHLRIATRIQVIHHVVGRDGIGRRRHGFADAIAIAVIGDVDG